MVTYPERSEAAGRCQKRVFGNERGTVRHSDTPKNAEITVSLLPVMAARWLVPRPVPFTARFPHINLHIKTGQSLANFKSDGVDIAIRFGLAMERTARRQASR